MSIYQNAKDDIALALTSASAITITSAHFDILKVRPATAEESTRNTKAHISFNASSPIRSSADVYFNRLDIASLRKIRNPNLPPTSIIGVGVSSHSLFAVIRNDYGATFTTDDLEETFSTADGDAVQILIKAKSSSQGWTGEDTFTFAQPPHLSLAFSTFVLTGF